MTTPFLGPMLATQAWDSAKKCLKRQFDYPVVVCPKIDGQRATQHDGVPKTRSGKVYSNDFVRTVLGGSILDGLDSELCVGEPNDPQIFSKTRKGVGGKSGMPEFHAWVFDDYLTNPAAGKWERYLELEDRVLSLQAAHPRLARHLRLVPHELIHNEADLLVYIEKQLAAGYEGIMVSSYDGPYIHKRSTLKEGILLKIKPYDFEEGLIVRFEEEMANTNESFIDELGRSKKSNTKDAKESTGRLGKFICTNPRWEGTFMVSATSMSHAMRARIWAAREGYLNRYVRFKHFEHGAQDKPRHPIFDEFRDSDDMSF